MSQLIGSKNISPAPEERRNQGQPPRTINEAPDFVGIIGASANRINLHGDKADGERTTMMVLTAGDSLAPNEEKPSQGSHIGHHRSKNSTSWVRASGWVHPLVGENVVVRNLQIHGSH